ncbi:hypothetical protein FRB90_000415 [Tulasnella sp. 427]|nr:hypothetical protein FRB90_000415 [Tulasnella sp. 427]
MTMPAFTYTHKITTELFMKRAFLEDEETAYESSDDEATLFEEDLSGDSLNALDFPNLLEETLDVPKDLDADLDFYSSLFDERLDFERPFWVLEPFDEQLAIADSDPDSDLDFYPYLLDERLNLPDDDDFVWPTTRVAKKKTVRSADTQAFQDEWRVFKYPSLLDERLDVPADGAEHDFDRTAPIIPAIQIVKAQC